MNSQYNRFGELLGALDYLKDKCQVLTDEEVETCLEISTMAREIVDKVRPGGGDRPVA